jgi:hypothetical protein
MAFKRSDLKNWTVNRSIDVMPGASFKVDIKVLSETDGMAIVDQGTDLETAKGFITGVSGYQDEKGKEMSLADFWEDVKTLPPTVIHKIALECVNAQHDAAIKN